MNTLWLWNRTWVTLEERGFISIETPSCEIDRVLLVVGLIDSRSEAQRLVKAGAISWRRDDGTMDWQKVTDFRQKLESGWPWVVRVGNGNWRSVAGKPQAGETVRGKNNQFPGLALVMSPTETQSIDCWSELWR